MKNKMLLMSFITCVLLTFSDGPSSNLIWNVAGAIGALILFAPVLAIVKTWEGE